MRARIAELELESIARKDTPPPNFDELKGELTN